MAVPVVHDETYDVDRRLAELDLKRDVLIDALRQGEFQRRNASPLDPPISIGITAWGRTTRALREGLVPLGWTPNDRFNLSTVLSPNGRVAIAVASGDEDTGDTSPEAQPRTRYRRGATYKRALERNEQLEMFPETNSERDPLANATVTWILLRYSTDNAVFAELSRPLRLGDGDRITEWAERIVLGEIELEKTVRVDSDETPVDRPDVTVKRKSV
jgi:hypothetical protein